VQAAKAAAVANRTAQAKAPASRAVVQRAAQKAAAQKAATRKSAAQGTAKPPVRQLRAENGKQVKVIAPKAAAKKDGKRDRVASR
jgi:hypothetical protein